MSRIVTSGETMVLFLAEPGMPLRMANTFRRSIAGAEANVAVGLARLGHGVDYVGRVGEDALGDLIVRALRAEGVNVSGVRRDPDAPTGILVRDAVMHRSVEVTYVRSGSAGSRLDPSDLPSDLEGVDLVHVTGITPVLSDTARAATFALVDRAQAAGVPVSVDPNLRFTLAPHDVVLSAARELLARADIVLAAADELMSLTGLSRGAIEASPASAVPNARLVVVKHDAGSSAEDRDGVVRDHLERVPSIDPVGAGDAFDAGFLDAWLRGRPLAEALAIATRAGRHVATVPGDQEGLPYTPAMGDEARDVSR